MGTMDTNGLLLMYCLILVFLITHANLCLGRNDKAGVNGEFSPFQAEKKAGNFLKSPCPSRQVKRVLYHECFVEHCSFDEANDHFLDWGWTMEYLYTMACRLWPCGAGCRCDRAHPGLSGSGPHWRVCTGTFETQRFFTLQ
ncbi:uncharacterized protein LOC118431575 [Branchiostoma floridae]|uniref:Uncharacterized protein LOC118431575 n=1 Tax=Branchiostoma floridae TaxID=7739 RepID=A0A9J7MGD0_BRAFL|nr:uncharacterized protein LOC118431575 [Branchiostoma floridae]